MVAEILMALTSGLTVGACIGYSVKHIQDTKYLNEYEKFAEHSCKKIADKGQKAIDEVGKAYQKDLKKAYKRNEELYAENLALKKEIRRQKEFFEVPDLIGGTEWL